MPTRFVIRTPIEKDYKEVYYAFDRNLFEYLTPDSGMEIIHFGGSRTGDEIKLKFTKPMKGEWVSKITDHFEYDHQCGFIDEGVKLPFGLKYWKHRHLIEKEGDGCVIVDDITFSYGYKILDLITLPGLFLSFYPRKGQYKKYFSEIYQEKEEPAS